MKIIRLRKVNVGSTEGLKLDQYYEAEQQSMILPVFKVCATGLKRTLGICSQAVGTTIELEIAGVYRVAQRESIAMKERC